MLECPILSFSITSVGCFIPWNWQSKKEIIQDSQEGPTKRWITLRYGCLYASLLPLQVPACYYVLTLLPGSHCPREPTFGTPWNLPLLFCSCLLPTLALSRLCACSVWAYLLGLEEDCPGFLPPLKPFGSPLSLVLIPLFIPGLWTGLEGICKFRALYSFGQLLPRSLGSME